MDYRVKVENHWNAVPRNSIGGRRLADIVSGTLTQPPPVHGDHWGIWKYDAERLVLVAGEACKSRGYGYEVSLTDMSTSAGMLDWIFQVAGKSWATPEDLGDLVRALNDLLNPQGNLCGSGVDRRFNVRQHLKTAEEQRDTE